MFRFRFLALIPGLTALSVCASAQTEIEVLSAPVLNLVGLGVGGTRPVIETRPQSPTGLSLESLQPASYAEFRVACNSPGLYRIRVNMAQWQDSTSVLAFETRPLGGADDSYVTRFATRDSREYGQTTGPYYYADLGQVEDAEGTPLVVPLWAGDNVFRVQNVSGRHNPAYQYPTNPLETHNRDWDFYWSNIHLGRITLQRVADLPAFGTVTGRINGDRPAGLGVRRALVTANPVDQSPPEPSHFWKWGWYTHSRDNGAYTLNVPLGNHEIKAGRPSSYQVQGSIPIPVEVAADGNAVADPWLKNIFQDNGQGRQIAVIQSVYFDSITGVMGIIPQDGENGYKMGYVDVGDSCSMYVDAPRAGSYEVFSSYFNGGSAGATRVTTDAGLYSQVSQPVTGWNTQGLVKYPSVLSLRQGTNMITQSLVSGSSDQNAVHLVMPAVTAADAGRALRIAAGLTASNTSDIWQGALTGGPEITLTDALRLLQALGTNPL